MLYDVKARCSACFTQYEDREGIKTCSRCHLVRYCSTACQRAAWPEHKKWCNSEMQEMKRKDPKNKAVRYHDKFTKFINAWRDALTLFALWAFNTPNHPAGYLQQQVFVVLFEEKDDPESHLDSFYIDDAFVQSRTGVASNMRRNGVSDSFVKNWESDLRDPTTLHMMFVAGSISKPMCTGVRSARPGEFGPGHDIAAHVPPRIANALEKWWFPCLHDAVLVGQPWQAANYPCYVASKEGLNMKETYQSQCHFPPFLLLEKANMEHRMDQGQTNVRWFPEDGEPDEDLVHAQASQIIPAPQPLTKGQKKNKRKKAQKEAAKKQKETEEKLAESMKGMKFTEDVD